MQNTAFSLLDLHPSIAQKSQEIPASEINPEMVKALQIILKGHTSKPITSALQLAKDDTGVIYNVTCNQDRFSIIVTQTNYKNPQVYALKPNGAIK
jgi:hypothetical protein